jgi:GNAT superfamily N-acetyltransferase
MSTVSSHPLFGGVSVTIRPNSSRRQRSGERVREKPFPGVEALSLPWGVNELSPAELKRLCDVDGRHAMAFVATIQRDGHEAEIGVSRYAECSSDGVGEMAPTIADAWRHHGVGQLLMNQLITYARTHGVKKWVSRDDENVDGRVVGHTQRGGSVKLSDR